MQKIILTLILTSVSYLSLHAQTTINKQVVRKGTTTTVKKTVLKPIYNIDQFAGKWQEVRRVELTSSKKENFKDTLQLDFNKRDSVIVRDGVSISQKGFAAVNDHNLQIAGDSYLIVSFTKTRLVVNDGEFVRDLQRKKRFYHETLGNTIIPKENISDPLTTVNTTNLKGNWIVYRTQAVPGVAADSSIIKEISFTQVNEDGSVSGDVTFVKADQTQKLPFTAVFNKGTFDVTTQVQQWKLNAYKANGKEFIFGQQGGLVYFSKQL